MFVFGNQIFVSVFRVDVVASVKMRSAGQAFWLLALVAAAAAQTDTRHLSGQSSPSHIKKHQKPKPNSQLFNRNAKESGNELFAAPIKVPGPRPTF